MLCGLATTYAIIANDLDKQFTVDHRPAPLPTPGVSLDEGLRLAKLRGCAHGCHGKEGRGSVMFSLFDGTKVVAPDLVRLVQQYSDSELERIIRHGVRPDGTSVLAVMPSEMVSSLSDTDLAAIIAYFRSQPPSTESLPELSLGPIARAILVMMIRSEAGTVLAADHLPADTTHPATTPTDKLALGKYLALTACTECHGRDLMGVNMAGQNIPALTVAVAYNPEQFKRLMTTGVALGDRELKLMKTVAEGRFVHFTDSEREALHEYLKTLSLNP